MILSKRSSNDPTTIGDRRGDQFMTPERLGTMHQAAPDAPVCTKNHIRIGNVMESPKLAE
jgi:hypothetical protein